MRTDRTRVTYRPGQWLAGGDLTAESTAEAELLAVHQARVHDTWGVVHGFVCTVSDDGGLFIEPGLGFDALGRPLLLSKRAQVRPPREADALLVVSYADRLGTDGCRPGDLPVEQPVLRWRRPAGDARVGIELPLALLHVRADGDTVDLGVRKVAHALVRPKVATGRVQRSSAGVQGTYGNWTMWVPTSAGGLSSPSPAYFVALDQHPWGELADFGSTEPPPLQRRLAEWIGPFVAVEAVASSGFSLRVSGRLGNWNHGTYPPVTTNPVGLSWVGVDTTFQVFDHRWFLNLRNLFLFPGGVQ